MRGSRNGLDVYNNVQLMLLQWLITLWLNVLCWMTLDWVTAET